MCGRGRTRAAGEPGGRSNVSERFTVDYESYVNFSVIAADRLAQRAVPSTTPRPDLRPVRSAVLNWGLEKIFAAERGWVPRFRLPFGVSLFVAARERAISEVR